MSTIDRCLSTSNLRAIRGYSVAHLSLLCYAMLLLLLPASTTTTTFTATTTTTTIATTTITSLT
jgi:hypothetical protein